MLCGALSPFGYRWSCYGRNLAVNQSRHDDAHYLAPSASFHGRAMLPVLHQLILNVRAWPSADRAGNV